MSPTTLSQIKRKLRRGDLVISGTSTCEGDKDYGFWFLYDGKTCECKAVTRHDCPTPTLEAAASRITKRQWVYFWEVEEALQERANTNMQTNTGELMRALGIKPTSQRVFTDHLRRLQESGYLTSVEKKGDAGNVIYHDWKLTGKKPIRF